MRTFLFRTSGLPSLKNGTIISSEKIPIFHKEPENEEAVGIKS